jgi:tRNA threonylcarbamoyladenosine biosynthesis protein TsaB
MKLLAIETATEACSAALYVDGEIDLRYQIKARGHSELILGMLDDLLAGAELSLRQLDCLSFGRGPGSFTGVRIATGVIQGVAFGSGLPVVPVSTLAALAQGGYRALGETKLLPAYDARMQELYWAAYEINAEGLAEPTGQERVCGCDEVSMPQGEGWYGLGSGWAVYGERLSQHSDGRVVGYEPDLLCSAHDVALLAAEGFSRGQALAPEMALPVYLRNQVAQKKAI